MKRLVLAMGTVVMCAAVTALAEDKKEAKVAVAPPPAEKKLAREPDLKVPRRMPGMFNQMASVVGLSDEQQKKLMEIQDARDKAIQELNNKFQDQMASVFTPEQKAKWNETTAMDMLKREFSKITLSDDQNAKIKSIVAAQTKGQLLAAGPASWQTLRAIMTSIRTDVITEEQKAALRPAGAMKVPPQVEEKKPEATPEAKAKEEPKK